MKQEWMNRYKQSADLAEKSMDVLTGFNANIDVIHQVSDLELDFSDVEPELVKRLSSVKHLKSSIKYCIKESENHEVDIADLELELEGDDYLGGQAGIMSNFLAGTGKGVIFYTPLLSEELASKIDDKVLYPVIDGEFMLKNVRDASNTDRTKRNHIFEFNHHGDTGRLIVSDTLKGFGPYFRKGVEDNLDTIQENVDCAILSGFHDVEGNKEAKLQKAANQLEKLEKPVHLECVDKNRETTLLMIEHVLPEVDSLGLDETEFNNLMDILDIEEESDGKLNLGKAFNAGKHIIEQFNLQRIHLHTYRYHLTLTEQDYHAPVEKIRKSMLYGELAATQVADKGCIPNTKDIEDFEIGEKEINGLEELRHFGDFFDLPDFEETGIGEIDGMKVVAIPTIIHPDPEKTVGMGDIISAGAFTSEFC